MDSAPVIVIPGAPLLVPQLGGTVVDEDVRSLRAAVCAAGAALGRACAVWTLATPAGRAVSGPFPTGAGTFRGFGADVRVTADPAAGTLPADPDWPLDLLIAAWLRGAAAPHVRLVPPADAPAGAGTVVVLDGPNTLTERAPGGYRPEDAGLFARQVAAVCAGGETAGLDPAWCAAARLTGGAATALYRDQPFGVGYLVATAGLPAVDPGAAASAGRPAAEARR